MISKVINMELGEALKDIPLSKEVLEANEHFAIY